MEELADKVLNQILDDIYIGDYTAIERLIQDLPVENLRAFLSEVE